LPEVYVDGHHCLLTNPLDKLPKDEFVYNIIHIFI